MSWALVWTCSRCGKRAEIEIATPKAAAARAALALRQAFELPSSDYGCPSCDPEVGRALWATGIDPLDWQAALNRAFNRGPA